MEDSQRTPSERDALFAILAEPRRHRLLDILDTLESGRRTALYDLSERLAADEGSATGEQRHDAAIALHHVDLPMLDDAGIVEYDPDAKIVETTDLPSGRSAASADILVAEE